MEATGGNAAPGRDLREPDRAELDVAGAGVDVDRGGADAGHGVDESNEGTRQRLGGPKQRKAHAYDQRCQTPT